MINHPKIIQDILKRDGQEVWAVPEGYKVFGFLYWDYIIISDNITTSEVKPEDYIPNEYIVTSKQGEIIGAINTYDDLVHIYADAWSSWTTNKVMNPPPKMWRDDMLRLGLIEETSKKYYIPCQKK